MFTVITLAALLGGQAAAHAAPHPAPADGQRQEVRVFTMGGPGGPGGAGGPMMMMRDAHPDLDKNNDGFVSREEFTAPQTAAFDMLDTNHDNRISPEEFTAGRAAARVILGGAGGPGGPAHFQFSGPGAMGPDGPGARMMMFRHGGAEGPDGPLPPGANVEIRRIGGPGADGPGDLDKDHDGKVSEDEFLAPMREAFQRMDADHSGALEAGEHGSASSNVVIMRRSGPDGE